MLAILVLILVVPAINLRQLFRDEVPTLLRVGDMNIAYAAGMFFSVVLILVWYYAYTGHRRPRIALGLIYVTTAGIATALAALLIFMGSPLPGSWQVGLIVAVLYGAAGWALVYSQNIRAFQRYQLELRRGGARHGPATGTSG